MTNVDVSRRVESVVPRPGRGVALVVGMIFLTIGVGGIIGFTLHEPAGAPWWMMPLFFGAFALMGGLVVVGALAMTVRPARVRHAPPEVLADVPNSPVIVEGWTVHGRVTHELVEVCGGYVLQPAERVWRNDKTFLLGFGMPFLVFFASLLTWSFHERQQLGGWIFCAAAATAVTLLCGGTALVLIALMIRASYRRLTRLTIPADGGSLEFDSPLPPDVDKTDWNAALDFMFVGDTKRHRLVIPRELVVAVQLCPWKYVMGNTGERSTTRAVQGLLVLALRETRQYQRIPLLLTGDAAGAATLMAALADRLAVPYLFHADARGWAAEEQRARTRPPVKSGGIMS